MSMKPTNTPLSSFSFDSKATPDPKIETVVTTQHNEPITQELKIINQPSITLTKNTKGYNWEIKVYATTVLEALDIIIAADMRLKTQYGNA